MSTYQAGGARHRTTNLLINGQPSLPEPVKKTSTNITRQAMQWNAQGKRKWGCPSNSWRRDVEAEIVESGLNWGDLVRNAKNLVQDIHRRPVHPTGVMGLSHVSANMMMGYDFSANSSQLFLLLLLCYVQFWVSTRKLWGGLFRFFFRFQKRKFSPPENALSVWMENESIKILCWFIKSRIRVDRFYDSN